MLDLRFFRNPRFTAATTAITLVFFAMFGSYFIFTQYLQFVRGYDPLSAGLRMLPWALAYMASATQSAKLVERFGQRLVVSSGLVIAAAGLGIVAATSSAHQQLLVFALGLVVQALGMGLTTAPSTGAIMRSLPLHKAGVGSAVNDTTRELGGALGVAVIGSLVATHFRTNDRRRGQRTAGEGDALARRSAAARRRGRWRRRRRDRRRGARLVRRRVQLHAVDRVQRGGRGVGSGGVAAAPEGDGRCRRADRGDSSSSSRRHDGARGRARVSRAATSCSSSTCSRRSAIPSGCRSCGILDQADGAIACNEMGLPVAKSTGSHHLKVLREAGVVTRPGRRHPAVLHAARATTSRPASPACSRAC